MSELKARIVTDVGESYLVFSVDGVDVAKQRVVQASTVTNGSIFDVTVRGFMSSNGEFELIEV